MVVSTIPSPTSHHGPQYDRDSRSILQTSITPNPSLLQNLSNTGPVASERSMYEQELSKLRSEKEFLVKHVGRLTNELRSYQIKYPPLNNDDQKNVNMNDLDEDLPAWMETENVISPLFSAYDVRISELVSITESQRSELDSFLASSEQLVAENELLRENQLKDIKKLFSEGGGGNNPASENNINVGNNSNSNIGGHHFLDTTNGDVEERLSILMEENSLLSEQNAILSKELESCQEEIFGREQNIITLTDSMTDAAMSMKSMEENVNSLSKEKMEAEDQIMMKNAELGQFQTMNGRIKNSLKENVAERNELMVKIHDFKAELNSRENECDELSAKVSVSLTRINEVSGKLAAKTMTADSMGEKLRRTTAELTTTRTDAEGMMAVMNGMEKQLSEFAAREEGVSQLSRECKTKVEDALLARDQSSAICASLRREVAKLMEANKNAMENNAMQSETVIDAVKSRLQNELASKEREIHELTIVNAKMKSMFERTKREGNQASETYTKLKAILDAERSNLKGKFGEMQQRLNEAESRSEMESSQRIQTEQQVRDQHHNLENKENTINDLQAKLDKSYLEAQGDLDTAKSKVRDAEDKFEQKKFEIEKLKIQVEEAKSTNTHQTNEYVKKLNGELEDTKLMVESARVYAREKENLLQEQIEANGRMIDKVRGEKDKLVAQLEKKLNEEREVGQKVGARNTELSNRINMLAAEKSELHIIAVEHENRVEEFEGVVGELEERIADLTGQLSSNVAELGVRIKEEGKMKAELHRLELQMQRR